MNCPLFMEGQEGLLNTALQHSYSLVIITYYTEGGPRENITLQLSM